MVSRHWQRGRALARRHPVLQGIAVPVLHRLKGYKKLHYELKPSE
jgi:uncharacterized protein